MKLSELYIERQEDEVQKRHLAEKIKKQHFVLLDHRDSLNDCIKGIDNKEFFYALQRELKTNPYTEFMKTSFQRRKRTDIDIFDDKLTIDTGKGIFRIETPSYKPFVKFHHGDSINDICVECGRRGLTSPAIIINNTALRSKAYDESSCEQKIIDDQKRENNVMLRDISQAIVLTGLKIYENQKEQ